MIKSKISPRLIGRASQHSLAIVKCKTRRDFAKIARNNVQIVREFPFISSIAVFGKTEELFEITLVDKKRKGDEITVVMPEKLGKSYLKKMSVNEWKEFIL